MVEVERGGGARENRFFLAVWWSIFWLFWWPGFLVVLVTSFLVVLVPVFSPVMVACSDVLVACFVDCFGGLLNCLLWWLVFLAVLVVCVFGCFGGLSFLAVLVVC